jgi:flavin reductase (DIM6/NTAB) family NADH-FMN oxidoreductase RutF
VAKSGTDTDKIKEAGFSLVDSIAVKAPIIDDVTVAFECKVIGQFETGDHTVFVGEVVATRGDLTKIKHLYATSDYKFLV